MSTKVLAVLLKEVTCSIKQENSRTLNQTVQNG